MGTNKEILFSDLSRIHCELEGEIIEAVRDIVRKSTFIHGQVVSDFENVFSNYIGIKYCVACANGTDAIQAALYGLRIERGAEVIVPAHTWVSTAESVIEQGCIPKFCDSGDHYLIDEDSIEDLITERTSAVIVVHMAGLPCNMKKVKEICKRHSLRLIEDCAQAHGSKYEGAHVGSFGDVSTFSFYPGKNLGALGDAGCIVTDNAGVEERVRLYCNHGGKGLHTISGINSRMDSIQAAVLLIKMKYLNRWLGERKKIALAYNRLLRNVHEDFAIPCDGLDGRIHSWHLYIVKTTLRDELRSYLNENSIQTNVNYPRSINQLDAFKTHTVQSCPKAEDDASKVLSLPIFPGMKEEEVVYVCGKIKEFFREIE